MGRQLRFYTTLGDELLLAPAYTSTDAELDEMVKRFRATIDEVENAVTAKL